MDEREVTEPQGPEHFTAQPEDGLVHEAGLAEGCYHFHVPLEAQY